ncbi:MAG: hypothetical protein D6689_06850 [Deltaproteobacteria bacterium]|nr:MAG: hypothetical protein D6689_06850 [Deltaproteobacteria bacterium]
MHIERRDVIDEPIDRVYALLRDELPRLAAHLPSVQRIDRVSAHETADGVDVVNHWYAIADIPGPLARFVKPELFAWRDTARWHDADRAVDYTLESFVAADLYDARGRNQLLALGPRRTELRVSCAVAIWADRIPGVPATVARRAVPLVETLVEQLLSANLRSVARAVAAYCRAHPE